MKCVPRPEHTPLLQQFVGPLSAYLTMQYSCYETETESPRYPGAEFSMCTWMFPREGSLASLGDASSQRLAAELSASKAAARRCTALAETLIKQLEHAARDAADRDRDAGHGPPGGPEGHETELIRRGTG
jgi:hypothetical protein